MKIPDCPRCKNRLRIVSTGDGEVDGRCLRCNCHWPLMIGVQGLEIMRDNYECAIAENKPASGY